jgi:hypothetical protein
MAPTARHQLTADPSDGVAPAPVKPPNCRIEIHMNFKHERVLRKPFDLSVLVRRRGT